MKLQHPPNGHRLKEELARVVARAEAAERDLAAAKARIAELEAQLAALMATMAAEVNIGESQTYRTS